MREWALKLLRACLAKSHLTVERVSPAIIEAYQGAKRHGRTLSDRRFLQQGQDVSTAREVIYTGAGMRRIRSKNITNYSGRRVGLGASRRILSRVANLAER